MKDNALIPKILVPCFFAFLAVLGIATYSDYGETFDYVYHLNYGEAMVVFIKTGARTFEDLPYMKYYGPVGDTLSAILLRPFMPAPYHKAVEIRHLTNFLISLTGLLAIYLSIKPALGRWFGIIGMALFLLMPGMYGHSFNNPKDVIFGSFYMLAIAGVLLHLRKKTRLTLALAAILTGIATDQRIGGVFIIPVFMASLVWASIRDKNFKITRLAQDFAIYLVITAITVYALYPYLWPAPFERITEVFERMGEYPGGELATTLFMGNIVRIDALPFTYVPVWVHITVPVLTLLFAWAGFITGALGFIQRRLDARTEDLFIVCVLAIALPVAAVIAKGSTLYDGIRHMIFIFYPISALGVLGLAWALAKLPSKKGKIALSIAFFTYYAFIVSTMARLHPYEGLYFNELAGGLTGAYGRFETDYWGSSYKEGVEWLNANTKGEVKVATGNHFYMTHYFRPGVSIDEQNPDFYISTTRYNDHERVKTGPVHVVERFSTPLLFIKPVHPGALSLLKEPKKP